jgi:hypothetical protein
MRTAIGKGLVPPMCLPPNAGRMMIMAAGAGLNGSPQPHHRRRRTHCQGPVTAGTTSPTYDLNARLRIMPMSA